MTRLPSAFFAFLILYFSLAIPSQGYSQVPVQSDSLDDQRGASQVCPDGSAPASMSDGSVGCPTILQVPRTVPGPEIRQNTTAGAAENANIGGQPRNGNLQQNRILPPEPLTEFQKFVAATTGQLLPIYGANLFRNVPSTFSPDDLTPVTSDYVLGPDDELRIRIWGQVNYSGNLRVDRSGDIYLPEVGSVHVAGLTFAALDQHLRAAVGRVYRNFDLSADMGRIRSIQIYVTGQARRPGVYTVSSLSTLVDALFASGGPSVQGSMRHIEVRRTGKTVADFDLYALLIHGDKSKDAHLLPEDVIFIPAAASQVAMTGSVREPAIYELRDAETIGELIDTAGKTTAVASDARISLERFGERQIRQAMEFPLDPSGLATPLRNGDILRVYSVLPAYQKTVTLRGDVANQGRFAWHEGMRVSDLIPDRDSLLSRDYWWKRSHLGLPAPEFEPFIPNFDALRRQIPGSSGYPNANYPTSNYSGSSTSETASPYPNSPTAQDALTSELTPIDRQDQDISGISPRDASQTGNGGSLASQSNETSIPGGANSAERTQVRLSAPEIDWNYAVIERLDPETLKTSLISFDLGKLVLKHDASQDLTLQPGDTVTIFSQGDIRVPLEEQTKYIRLEGEFLHAGVYSVLPGETLRDLVRRAGGFSPKAYLYGSEFDRESTRVLQQQRIDEYVRRADLDAGRGTLALTTSSTSSAGSVANTSAATAAEQALLARLKQIRATGRIVLSFLPSSGNIDEVPAISLENGDRFSVPPTPATINVVGAVYDQNSFLYRNRAAVGQYLRVAGGPDRDADWRHTFVIRADGSVVSRDAVKGPWGNTFKDLKLYPGDTIIVPDKSLRPTALRGVLDWTQIFSQLAIGAAAVEVLK